MGFYSSNNYQNHEITFPSIVMNQVKIIQSIYSKELRDGEKILKNALGEQVIEAEDTRYSFLQSVEMFGNLLEPYFIKGTERYKGIKKDEFDDFCELLDKELVEILEVDDFVERARKIFFIDEDEDLMNKAKNDTAFKTQLNTYFLNYKIKEARRIFRRLIKLFEENDFLASQGYSDSEEDSSMIYDESVDGPLDQGWN